jgi:RNA polymerase sigma-54 factor
MLNLQQRLSQTQKLSPQQIQYIKLLQLPTLALEQRIKAEMEINPLLEEGDEEDEELERDEQDSDDSDGEEAADEKEDEYDSEQSSDDEYDWEELLHSSDDLYGHKAQVDNSAEEDRREIPMASGSSLAELLGEQLTFLDLDETETVIAEQIIGSIDEDGYLRRSLDSIVDDLMFNYGITPYEGQVDEVLARIQRLEPVGIAARDLRECLLIQLQVLPERTTGRDTAINMLEQAYKGFTMKHYDQIMRKLDIGPHELQEAYTLVQRLDPKPGEGAFTAQQNYITPDFTVEVVDDEFIISLNGRNAPELRVNKGYRHMLETLSADQKKEAPTSRYDSDTKNFLKSKMESARWFINSIQQRRHTMLRVMHAIVEIQEEFFRFGEGNLKPMILKDIAEIIHMDISTVSRVVNGKYVQTEFGVYELKYFFSEGLTKESGEEISNKEVRAIIEGIVSKEDKEKPLSDQAIAKLLEERGFSIARRTVTKYREQLGIPVARMRKQIVLD